MAVILKAPPVTPSFGSILGRSLGDLVGGNYRRKLTLEDQQQKVEAQLAQKGYSKLLPGEISEQALRDGRKDGTVIRYGDDYYNFDRITVTQSQPGHLKAGGPLDSSVDVKRTGRFLNLSYALKGIGGLSYTSAADRGDSPGFRILKGDKEIETGNFEYG